MGRALATIGSRVLLFAAALVAILRLAGTSPIVWVDTFNDENEVQQCLVDDSCTLTGVTTSVPGQTHAVAWLELRALLERCGVGIDGTHVTMSILNAIGAVLVFHVATELAGPLAGAVATYVFLHRIDALLRATALYNSSILLFFGAAFVLSCTAVVMRPSVISVACAALVAAVMANIHLACVLTGASVVWVALAAPRRRVSLAAFGATAFALATYAMAPPTWTHNFAEILHHEGMRGYPAMVTGPNPAMMAWTFFGVAAWLLSFAIRSPSMRLYRRQATGAVAVIVPFVSAFLIAPRVGLHAEAKYLLHVKAASAIAAAVPIGLLMRAVARALSVQSLLSRLERAVPFALAFLVALPGGFGVTAGALQADDERMPSVHDVREAAHILSEEYGWDAAHMRERLKTPHGLAVLMGFEQLAAAVPPRRAAGDGASSAVLIALKTEDLPDPMPPQWRVIRRSSRTATLLAVLPSRIDWSTLVVCTETADGSPKRCERSGWRSDQTAAASVPNLPPGANWRGILQLWLPLRPLEFASEIFMPRRLFVCAGRIVGATGSVEVDADQRHALIPAAAPGAEPSLIKLEWDVGAPECNVLWYEGLPPFFVEGEPQSARAIAAILGRQERAP